MPGRTQSANRRAVRSSRSAAAEQPADDPVDGPARDGGDLAHAGHDGLRDGTDGLTGGARRVDGLRDVVDRPADDLGRAPTGRSPVTARRAQTPAAAIDTLAPTDGTRARLHGCSTRAASTAMHRS
jgi:hypothetical protein